jgi:L-aminopeptidase/D-esterase-like protein
MNLSQKLFIDGIRIGHAHSVEGGTGCTVVLCESGATAGVDVRGGAPGTRETDLLNPVNMIEKIHAVFISGGSAFGLDVASGVSRYLEERDIGYQSRIVRVPIVSGAILFDLDVGDPYLRPGMDMGYRACQSAAENQVEEGCVGAGTGASVGKLLGMNRAMKGGTGYAGICIKDLKVCALASVNCLGDVRNPENGNILAGLLNEEKNGFLDTQKVIIEQNRDLCSFFPGNTTIGIVITNGKLSKSQATKISSMAHDGFARTIRPSHTMFDGDTVFTLGTGEIEADPGFIGILATRVMEEAICRGVKTAVSLYDLPCYSNLQ